MRRDACRDTQRQSALRGKALEDLRRCLKIKVPQHVSSGRYSMLSSVLSNGNHRRPHKSTGEVPPTEKAENQRKTAIKKKKTSTSYLQHFNKAFNTVSKDRSPSNPLLFILVQVILPTLACNQSMLWRARQEQLAEIKQKLASPAVHFLMFSWLNRWDVAPFTAKTIPQI